MSRSYQQHCGLAAALDVTGRRWTLLLVRDLEPGPRRFGELLDQLPGVSTDLLTDRLRDLEAAGAIERRSVGRGHEYALTERGRELATICHDLARWGMPLLPPVASTPHRTNARWALQTMAANARPVEQPLCIHIDFTDAEPLTLLLDHDGGTVRYGRYGDPDSSVELVARNLMQLLDWAGDTTRPLPADIQVAGSEEQLATALRAAPLHLTAD